MPRSSQKKPKSIGERNRGLLHIIKQRSLVEREFHACNTFTVTEPAQHLICRAPRRCDEQATLHKTEIIDFASQGCWEYVGLSHLRCDIQHLFQVRIRDELISI